jgi:phosphocarrier protein FPr
VSRQAGAADAAIFEAHLMLLEDTDLLDDARRRIDDGAGAASAWDAAVRRVVEEFRQLADEYLRARTADVREVGDQVMRHLLGISALARTFSGVVIAADLTPAEAADLEPGVVAGIVLVNGSPTSHAAILARAKGIPMLTGAAGSLLALANGTPIAFDGSSGELVVDPDPSVLADFAERAANSARKQAAVQAAAAGPAVTRDGFVIAVTANIGSLDEAKAAADAYADGAGLVRTEFLFHTRAEPPSRDEQESIYRGIADAFGGRPVVFRTLDAGGDKPLPFAPVAPEHNPYLGVRGIRLSLRHKALLRDQLAALVRVATDVPIGVMFPMVSTLDELIEARALLLEVADGRLPDGLEVGVMVEVPAVALKAGRFADHVDFFSIGTNDLTQYALAAERGNAAVAQLSDALDPGVLRLVSEVCRQAAGRAKVSVCGEVASDPVAAGLLIGLGVESLSVSVPAIAGIKQMLRGLDRSEAAAAAERALALPDAASVRALARTLNPDRD